MAGDMIEVTMTRRVPVSVRFPCSHTCTFKVRIGTYRHLGDGFTKFHHCEVCPSRDGRPNLAEYKITSLHKPVPDWLGSTPNEAF